MNTSVITTPINQAKLTKALNKAKIELMMKGSVFLSTILFSLEFKWEENIPTAGTTGKDLLLNPNFFYSLTKEEQVFLLAHEAWHVAFDHITRGENFKHKKYNIAADYVINLLLKNENYTLIPGGYIDTKFKDMSTEQVYNLIPDPPENDEFICDILKVSEKEIETIKENISNTLIRASIASKMEGEDAGKIPNEIAVFIEELVNPKLPWNIILQNYMTEFKKDDYSWARPNRRFVSQNIYLPTQHSSTLQNIAVAVDSSYSVSDEDFKMFISEIEDIKVSHMPEVITIVDFDTKIKKIHELTADNDIRELNFTGRGGTDLYPVFKHFNDNPPSLLIVFSDLHCTAIKEETAYPVIWICVGNSKGAVNFGELIHIEN